MRSLLVEILQKKLICERDLRVGHLCHEYTFDIEETLNTLQSGKLIIFLFSNVVAYLYTIASFICVSKKNNFIVFITD